VVLGALTRWLARACFGQYRRPRFWTAQIVSLLTVAVIIFAIASIWFDQPGRLATVLGWIAAGVAVALQRVITAFAAYLIMLRGRVFTVGDRITIGGVRGDVVSLGLMQTTVLEMGEPPSVQNADPAMWVRGRQFSGRLVRVTNDKIFDSPVYNYTREFPFLWDEIAIPVRYADDHRRVESIMLDVARRHTGQIVTDAGPSLHELVAHYPLRERPEIEPRIYYRLTDNWIELSLRFLARDHGVRALKDEMSREILAGLEGAGIGVASATNEIVGFPKLEVHADLTPASGPTS
jgi:small-conductance mechanosensitive channel